MSRISNPTELEYYKSRLQRQVTVQEVESREIGRPSSKHPYWREFLEQMQENDELWQYSSSDEDWKNMLGETGVAIIRNGEIVDTFTLLHN